MHRFSSSFVSKGSQTTLSQSVSDKSNSQGVGLSSSGSSDPRFRAPTYTQLYPDDTSVHTSDLSRSYTSSGTPHSSTERGGKHDQIDSSASAKATETTGSSNESQPVIRAGRRNANMPRKRRQQDPEPPSRFSAAPRGPPPATFKRLPSFVKRKEEAGTSKARQSPGTFGKTSEHASNHQSRRFESSPDPPERTPSPDAHERARIAAVAEAAVAGFRDDFEQEDDEEDTSHVVGSKKRGISVTWGEADITEYDADPGSTFEPSAPNLTGLSFSDPESGDEGDPAQVDEIAALGSRPISTRSFDESINHDFGNQSRLTSEAMREKLARAANAQARSELRRIAASDDGSGSEEGQPSTINPLLTNLDFDAEMEDPEERIAESPDVNVRELSPEAEEEEEQDDDIPLTKQMSKNAQRKTQSRTPEAAVHHGKKRKKSEALPDSKDDESAKGSKRGRSGSRETSEHAGRGPGRPRKSRGSGVHRTKQWIWIFPPAWRPGTDTPGEDPPHDGTILLVPLPPEGYIEPGDKGPYRLRYRKHRHIKAPHYGCDPETSVYLGQGVFPVVKRGREGEKAPASHQEKRTEREPLKERQPVVDKATLRIVRMARDPFYDVKSAAKAIDLEFVRGPGADREESLQLGDDVALEDEFDDILPPQSTTHVKERDVSERREGSTRGSSRSKETAAKARPITDVVGPQDFEKFVGSRTGGPLLGYSTARGSKDGTTWELSSHLAQLEGVAESGPVAAVMSSFSTEPIGSFTQSQRVSKRRRIGGDSSRDLPRIGSWVIDPAIAETLTSSERQAPEYPDALEDVAAESGKEIDELRALRVRQKRLALSEGTPSASLLSPNQAPLDTQLSEGISFTSDRALSKEAGTALRKLDPHGEVARQGYAKQVRESARIPEYIKPSLINFILSDGYKIEEGSRLWDKKKWFFELGAAPAPHGGNMRLMLLVETSPPNATPHLIDDYICRLMRDDMNLSPWRDVDGRYLSSQSGDPVDGSYGILTVPMETHHALQKERDELQRQLESKERELVRTKGTNRTQKTKLNKAEETQSKMQKEVRELNSKIRSLTTSLKKETDRNESLEAMLQKGIQSRVLMVQSRAEMLEGDNARLQAQVALMKAQNAKTDDSVRRKAAMWDALQARQAEEEQARQRREAAADKRREAERQALQKQAAEGKTEEERRSAQIRLLAFEQAAAPRTNTAVNGVQPASTSSAPPKPSQQEAIADELAELAAEAAALGGVDLSTTGRRSRRSRAAPAPAAPAAPVAAPDQQPASTSIAPNAEETANTSISHAESAPKSTAPVPTADVKVPMTSTPAVPAESREVNASEEKKQQQEEEEEEEGEVSEKQISVVESA